MTATTGAHASDLRARMVDQIAAHGYVLSGRVEEVMRMVPRHRFPTAAIVEEAYAA